MKGKQQKQEKKKKKPLPESREHHRRVQACIAHPAVVPWGLKARKHSLRHICCLVTVLAKLYVLGPPQQGGPQQLLPA